MIMTRAQHYAAGCGLLASADASGWADDPATLYAVQSAMAHFLAANVDPDVYSDAKDYSAQPKEARIRHLVDPDSMESGTELLFAAAIDHHDPQRIQAELEERNRRIRDLERELGYR